MICRDTLLEGLAPDLEAMARACGPLIHEQDAMVRQGHLPRQGPLAAADQAHIRDRVVRGAERACDDEGGATARQASDAMNPGGLPAASRLIAGRMAARRRASIGMATFINSQCHARLDGSGAILPFI